MPSTKTRVNKINTVVIPVSDQDYLLGQPPAIGSAISLIPHTFPTRPTSKSQVQPTANECVLSRQPPARAR
jgi:hypothetical protein